MHEPYLTKETHTDKNLAAHITALMAACRESGDDGVSYPVDDECSLHYLLWIRADNDAAPFLAGALAVLPLSDESAECIAYVHPACRRRGYFSRVLLPEASDDLSELEFCFPVRNENIAVTAVLESTGAEYDRTEYLMERYLDDVPCTGAESPAAIQSSLADAGDEKCKQADIPEIFHFPPGDESAAGTGSSEGSCRLERLSDDCVCLYDVYIRPELRGMGQGRAMMISLLDKLKSQGVRHVLLHVSADNIPAVSLYKKTGFRTTETLSYYLF